MLKMRVAGDFKQTKFKWLSGNRYTQAPFVTDARWTRRIVGPEAVPILAHSDQF